jgi:hypothetical protein
VNPVRACNREGAGTINLPIIFRFSALESSDRLIQTLIPASSVIAGMCRKWRNRAAGSATRQELEALILDKLSNVLDNKQKANKFKNLLYAMSRVDKSIVKTGSKLKGKWMATERFK